MSSKTMKVPIQKSPSFKESTIIAFLRMSDNITETIQRFYDTGMIFAISFVFLFKALVSLFKTLLFLVLYPINIVLVYRFYKIGDIIEVEKE